MIKIVNCVFGEEIIVERRRKDEVVSITISRQDAREVGHVRLSTEDQVDVITALLLELPQEDKHKIIMSAIATMPDYRKMDYRPEDPSKRRR